MESLNIGSGWHDDSMRHRLAGMGYSTTQPNFVSNGHRKFRGKEKYIVKDYDTLGRFQGAVQRAINSTIGEEYWNEKTMMKNTRTGEEKYMSLKEAFESDDVWTFGQETWKVGRYNAFMQEAWGEGGKMGFDIRWHFNEEYIKTIEHHGFPLRGEGEGHIYVYYGESEEL